MNFRYRCIHCTGASERIGKPRKLHVNFPVKWFFSVFFLFSKQKQYRVDVFREMRRHCTDINKRVFTAASCTVGKADSFVCGCAHCVRIRMRFRTRISVTVRVTTQCANGAQVNDSISVGSDCHCVILNVSVAWTKPFGNCSARNA